MRVLFLFSFLFLGLGSLSSQSMVMEDHDFPESSSVSGRRSLADAYPLSATSPQLERLASLVKMARATKKTSKYTVKRRSFSTDCEPFEEDLGYISTPGNSPPSPRRSPEESDTELDSLAAAQPLDPEEELPLPFGEMKIDPVIAQPLDQEEELLFPFDENDSAFSSVPKKSFSPVPLTAEELEKERQRQQWYRDQVNFQNLLSTNPDLFPWQIRSHMYW